jgi:hypothetical protein
MPDPLADIGIKLTDGWCAKTVDNGVMLTGPKTVVVGTGTLRYRWEWAAVLRHHRIRFEYVDASASGQPAAECRA